ncbi:protein-glutamate methylesterase/protein-glutamine glutaminase [Paludisphaera borealis]|uniref:Protein-glutamate methylesterase/protein-glutamine glutaminase n=1 Tax=Paludisphaera borealis TaxID=1387353 RepID=A0A1U7CRR8_9BACT|nr:chemotaxis response regulator protein-glutamate methylesterase [Paludisphaera borealis]APW61589.1 Chemotaxis response regulator protein-glutamate methylesterase [Paludisphaera borealis]
MSDREPEPDSPPKRPDGSGPVRVLVVDDSALMRRLLTDLLSAAPGIEVVGTARDGREAVLKTAQLKPDVVTLDVEMPEISGLDALPAILAVHPVPVVMVSALTQEGAEVTLRALELGAVDFLPKPTKNQLAEMRAASDLLVAKVLDAAQSRVLGNRRAASSSRPARSAASPSSPSTSTPTVDGVVVIGISTGGPQALARVIPLLQPPSPPIVIVQHMPAQFTRVFADRLGRGSAVTVKEAAEGDLLIANRVLVAPGGRQLTLTGVPPRVRIALSDPSEPPVSGHRPSVDVLFKSAAKVYQGATVGVIMTGMGRDGVDGCKAILAAGGLTLGQDEETSVIYGMNKAAFLESAVAAQFPLDDLAAILQNLAAFREDHARTR